MPSFLQGHTSIDTVPFVFTGAGITPLYLIDLSAFDSRAISR
jgi:hypothetical protein